MKKASRYIKKNAYIPRILFVGFLVYVSVGIYYGKDFSLLSTVDLIFHEAGHVLFFPFGTMLYILGGTIAQLAVPLTFLYYFAYKMKDYFAAGVMLWWTGENLTNISLYMADANARALPLLGGNHDWFMLFNMWRMLDKAELFGNLLWQAGIMLILTGIMWSLMYSHKSIKGGMLRTIPGKKKLKKKVKAQNIKHDPSCSKHWEEVAKD